MARRELVTNRRNAVRQSSVVSLEEDGVVAIDAGAGVGDDDEDAAVAQVVKAALKAECVAVGWGGTGGMLTAQLAGGGGLAGRRSPEPKPGP